MSDRNEFLHPDFEPGEFDRVERELRQALATDVRRIQPAERLDTILRAAREAGPAGEGGGSGTRRWLVPVAAAAAVAVVIGGVWAANHRDDGQQTTPPMTNTATTQPSTPSPTPSSASASSSTGPSTSATAPPQTQQVTLPVYFVGPIGDGKTYKLFREFLPGEVDADQTAAHKAKAALVLAIDAQPYSNTDGYLQPWSGQTIGDVQVTPQLITIDLASSGNPDAAQTPEVRRLAVQELVWTAQAAVQKGNLPVRFTVDGGPARLFGSISTDRTFTRPSSSESWRDLAPIWVDSPSRDQVLPAGKPVTVKGQATVFEANVAWDLQRGSTAVKQGHATASVGAPDRGQYSIELGTLRSGTYTIHVWEPSAKDGSVAAERSVTFSVR